MRHLALLVLVACHATSGPGVNPTQPVSETAAEPSAAEPGAPSTLPPRIAADPPLETVLILATIHGNEHAGTPLVELLAGELARDGTALAGKRLVLLPVANPDGFAADRRGNASGVDLNRNFDSANWGARRGGATPLSEPESRAILRLLERHPPDRVVSIHQPVAVIDYDGPGEDFAVAVGAAAGLPVERIGSRPGSLGSYVGLDLGLPILTVELARGAEDLPDAELWERYGAMMLACVRWSPAD